MLALLFCLFVFHVAGTHFKKTCFITFPETKVDWPVVPQVVVFVLFEDGFNVFFFPHHQETYVATMLLQADAASELHWPAP